MQQILWEQNYKPANYTLYIVYLYPTQDYKA